SGNPGQHDGLEARRRTETCAATQRQHRTAAQTAPTRCKESTGLGGRACPIPTCRSLEESDVASRSEAETAIPLCRFARASRAPRLLAVGTASGRMVVDRVAVRRIGTDQVLALHSSVRHRPGGTRAHGQASLDHRTGLSGIEAGTRVGTLRRTWLARLPSSRYLMPRGLWLPGGRKESFFPLSPSRQSWTTNARTAARLPAARLSAFAPSGIIRAPSLR